MAQKHGLGRGLSSLIPPKGAAKGNTHRGGVSPSVPIRDSVETSTRPITEEIVIEDTTKDTAKDGATSRAQGGEDHRSQEGRNKHETKNVGKSGKSRSAEANQSPGNISESSKEVGGLSVQGIAVTDIEANTQQPRMYFDDDKLKELSESIKEHGIMQPLVVVRKGGGYELIAGERRLRASKLAGLAKVPAIVRGDMDEQKKLEMAIIENVQRHDLNVIEEAKSYKKLADEFNLTQEEVAQKMGKSRSVIANRMRLATLPIEIQRALVDGKISEGHAKVILSLDNPEKQRGLYEQIVHNKLSVRDTERVLSAGFSGVGGEFVASHTRGAKTPQERLLEDQLGAYFATKVVVKQKGKGGTIALSYYSEEELKDVLNKLKL